MPSSVADSSREHTGGFQKLLDAFLLKDGLAFADILSAERIVAVFRKHGCIFGYHGVYNTAVVVWSFLGQVLRDGKEASCRAAVARVVSYCQMHGLTPPTQDTGDYCRARAKLAAPALQELSREVAATMEESADSAWLWKGKYHAKLVDGFTFTMPDTPENQAKFPQQKAQKSGVGFPIARVAAIISLATACVSDLTTEPYKGKETGLGFKGKGMHKGAGKGKSKSFKGKKGGKGIEWGGM